MKWRHALVVVVAVVAISAQPVAAQNAGAVASKHTTFGNGSAGEPAPAQLQNTIVTGSGDSARVVLNTGSTLESFEDGDVTEYAGDTSALNPSTARATDGSYGLVDQSGGGTVSDRSTITRTDGVSVSEGGQLRVDYYHVSGSDNRFYFGVQSEVSIRTDVAGYGVVLNNDAGALVRKDAANGSGTNIETFSAPTETGWYEWRIDWADSGLIEVTLIKRSDGSTVATFSATDTTYTSGGIGFLTQADGSAFDSVRSGDVTVSSGTYVSHTHSAEEISAGWTNLSLSNASATVAWQEDTDADGAWTNVTSSTYSATGNVSADLSATTSDRWRVRVDFEVTGAEPVAELHDEGVLFESSTPTLSDPEPPDEMQIQNATGNVLINVSDADFKLAQGDSVTVSATDGDGTSLGSTTLTGTGTASLSYSSVVGENTIQWTATDAYGNTETFTQTFETPGVIEVRNESDPGTIISTASNITATFYGDDGETVIQKSSSNGTIPIAGVPTTTEYVVSVNANGYRPRRVRLTNLFDQRSVYLLSDSADAANIQFELNDRTGNFPSDSELIISKPITDNGSTEYVDIAADSFGATGSTRFILEDNSRYLLRVKSPDGSVREIGAYTTSGAAVEPIPIGRVSVGSTIDSGAAVQTGYVTEDGQTYLRVTYADPDNQTESLTYSVRNETGAVVEPERTVDVTDEYRATIPVNSTDAATVNYSYTRNTEGGLVTKSGNASVGGLPGIARTWPIDEQVLSLSGYLLIVGVTGLIVIRDPGVAALAGTVVASLLTFIGVTPIPYMALGVAGVTAVLFNVGRVR